MVSYAIMRHLQQKGWLFAHYHPPGGQAHWSVEVSKSRFVFDAVAYKEQTVLVFENKGKRSQRDIQKLCLVAEDVGVRGEIQKHVERHSRAIGSGRPAMRSINMIFCHGFYSIKTEEPTDCGITLCQLSADDRILFISAGANDQWEP
jgi:hypothetical protein